LPGAAGGGQRRRRSEGRGVHGEPRAALRAVAAAQVGQHVRAQRKARRHGGLGRHGARGVEEARGAQRRGEAADVVADDDLAQHQRRARRAAHEGQQQQRRRRRAGAGAGAGGGAGGDGDHERLRRERRRVLARQALELDQHLVARAEAVLKVAAQDALDVGQHQADERVERNAVRARRPRDAPEHLDGAARVQVQLLEDGEAQRLEVVGLRGRGMARV